VPDRKEKLLYLSAIGKFRRPIGSGDQLRSGQCNAQRQGARRVTATDATLYRGGAAVGAGGSPVSVEIHPSAVVLSAKLGDDVTIGPYAVIADDVVLG
jgi:hypothetical protein